jgi:hypothetical protein
MDIKKGKFFCCNDNRFGFMCFMIMHTLRGSFSLNGFYVFDSFYPLWCITKRGRMISCCLPFLKYDKKGEKCFSCEWILFIKENRVFGFIYIHCKSYLFISFAWIKGELFQLTQNPCTTLLFCHHQKGGDC